MLEAGVVPGRIVHFVRDGKCYAAIVVSGAKPNSNHAGLRVFSSERVTDDGIISSADYSAERLESTYHWPLDHRIDPVPRG